jgi:hypothetical protein
LRSRNHPPIQHNGGSRIVEKGRNPQDQHVAQIITKKATPVSRNGFAYLFIS